MTTPARPRRKTDRAQRRQERIARSEARQLEYARARFEAAETPLDLYEAAYSLLRGRLVKFQRLAENAVARAGTEKERAAAERRQLAARATVQQVCGEAAEYLERAANRLDTTRR